MNTHANLPRRSYDPGAKLGMVLEALKQEQSIAKVASDNMVNVNQLSRWIREYREGAAWAHKAQIGFLPVEVTTKVPALPTETISHTKPMTATLVFEAGHRLEITSPSADALKSLAEALR